MGVKPMVSNAVPAPRCDNDWIWLYGYSDSISLRQIAVVKVLSSVPFPNPLPSIIGCFLLLQHMPPCSRTNGDKAKLPFYEMGHGWNGMFNNKVGVTTSEVASQN